MLEVDLASAPAAGQFDALNVVGAAQLDGTLRIDVSQLPSLTADAIYTVVTASTGAGAFDAIEVIDPTGVADDYYFSPFYGTAPVPGGATAAIGDNEYQSGIHVLSKGDADGINGVDEDDARVFAAVLFNNELQGFRLGPGHTAALNFVSAFDFFKDGAPPGETLIDFDDIPGFVSAMSASQGIPLQAARHAFQQAYQQALAAHVPEPETALLVLGVLALAPAACRGEVRGRRPRTALRRLLESGN
ncbi:MAG: hypothetical protein DCC67_17770 [Planctomycetota bacterium]|nr:MAG: hypothetical protein DCC67_17770 [Planctomycetota bacterium]